MTTLGSICTYFPAVCTTALGIFSDTRTDLVNQAQMDLYFKHFNAGSSLRNLDHMGQLMRTGKFQRFDYGVATNLQVYGTASPPLYPIEDIYIPIAMFVGKYDTLATPKDN